MEKTNSKAWKTEFALILWIAGVIAAFAIESAIKDLEWFKNLTGMLKTIFNNLGLVLMFLCTIALVYFVILQKISNMYKNIHY